MHLPSDPLVAISRSGAPRPSDTEPCSLNNLLWESDYPHLDSTWSNTRTLLEEALYDVRDDEALMIAEMNTRKPFNFWDGLSLASLRA